MREEKRGERREKRGEREGDFWQHDKYVCISTNVKLMTESYGEVFDVN
jgi:hypothetical protein